MLRWSLRISLVSALVSALFFGIPFLRSAEFQAKRQHQRLLDFAAQRNWPRFYLLLADDYRDAWEMSRTDALNAAREALSGFLMVSFDWKEENVSRDGKTVTLTGIIRMSGSGPTSSMITDHVNRIEKPWTFVWRKDGWKPSDWRLLSVANPEVSF